MKIGGILATGGNALPRSVVLEARNDGLYVQTGFGEPERLKWRSLSLIESSPGQYEVRRRFKRNWSIRLGHEGAQILGDFLDGGPASAAAPITPIAEPPPPEPEPAEVLAPEPETPSYSDATDYDEDEPAQTADLTTAPARYQGGTASERWTGMDPETPPEMPEPIERYRSTASQQWGAEEADLDTQGFSKIRLYFVGFIFAFLLIKNCGGMLFEPETEPNTHQEKEYAPIVPLPQEPSARISPANPGYAAPVDGERCSNADAYEAVRRLLIRLWYDRAYEIPIDIVSSAQVRVTALEGGRIEITSGAIHEFTVKELTALLAHQIAHIQNRDVFDNRPGFSIADEMAADARARRILLATRTSLRDGAVLLRKLKQLEIEEDPALRSHLALHPNLPQQLQRWGQDASMELEPLTVPLLTDRQEEALADACPNEAQTPPSR